MELHFYTTYDNVQMLREGDDIKVWTKEHATTEDVHVSFDMNRYSFHKLEQGIFEVSIIIPTFFFKRGDKDD